jgi:hypothetical protein
LDDIWEDQADYEDFVNSIKDIPGCSNIVIAPEPRWFNGEQWVAEMNAMLGETIGD